jgi:hypothetical protein
MAAGRPRKSTEDTWYDVFSGWSLEDQKVAVRVLSRLILEREREENRRARRTAEESATANGNLPLIG